MRAENADGPTLYSQYRAYVEGEPLIGALRSAVVVLFVINSGFVLVDWLVYPEKMAEFLRVRVALDLSLGLIFVWGSRRYPVQGRVAVSLGFAVLGLSGFTLIRNLGLLTAGLMVLCLLADALLLPALLFRLGPPPKGASEMGGF